MSKPIRIVLAAVAATVSLACLTAPAMADTPWQATHPRREEVNNRLANQNARIHQEVKEGEISRAKAARLHAADHSVRMEERRMAARHGGHLTKREQAKLNRRENRISRRIGP